MAARHRNIERRVARALLRLVAQAERRTDAGVLIDLPLSREDIAQMTGTTLFTVSRIINSATNRHRGGGASAW